MAIGRAVPSITKIKRVEAKNPEIVLFIWKYSQETLATLLIKNMYPIFSKIRPEFIYSPNGMTW